MEAKIREQSVPVILLSCMIFTGLIATVYRYRVPAAYDPEVMKVEIYKAASVTENGYTQWRDLDNLDFGQTKKIIEDDSQVIRKIRLVLTEEIECDEIQTCTRTIYRNGEPVRMTFYCYEQRPWNVLFRGFHRTQRMIAEGDLYAGEGNGSLGYERKRREIYYLPKGNIEKLEKYPDQKFLAQKEHAFQVWSGVL